LWFALLLAIVPASMVFGSMWVLLNAVWWRPLLGVVLLIPSVLAWGAMLLFAYTGFRIH
jgi:membrane-anchored protein YejM (alkaline phosphatase superfamily)